MIGRWISVLLLVLHVFAGMALTKGDTLHGQGLAATGNEKNKEVRVYVDMVADLFHYGHVAFLKQAKTLGDTLIVGICSDEDVAPYKRAPVLTLEERAYTKTISTTDIIQRIKERS